MNSIFYLEEGDFHLWDGFVDSLECGSIFNKSVFLKRIAEVLNLNFAIVVYLNESEEIAGGFAFCYKKKYGVKYIYFTPLAQYNFILIKDRETIYLSKKQSHHYKILSLILNFLEKEYFIIKFSFNINYKDIRPYIWKGYETNINYTFTKKITDTDKIYKEFDYALRKQIKKGEKLNYKIDSENNEINIKILHKLNAATYKRQNLIFKLSYKQFYNLINGLFINELAKIYTIYYEEKPISSTLLFIEKNKAYHMLIGTEKSSYNLGLNQVLMIEVFKDLVKNGINEFDFMGANVESIANYKAQFSFELKPFYSALKVKGILKYHFKVKKT